MVVLNASRISTVVVAAITANLRLGQAFGNVTLRMGEAGLPKRSVVNISQIATVDRSMLDGRIGSLAAPASTRCCGESTPCSGLSRDRER